MNIPKIHSISKKILVSLLGAFLSFFPLFHASANLLILRHDGGSGITLSATSWAPT